MKCMVIDGNSIINRAYYGIRPLTNREGLYTHAVFGFLTTLLRLKEEEQPDALCVTFDLHAPTFRHKADEAYKATRKPMPEAESGGSRSPAPQHGGAAPRQNKPLYHSPGSWVIIRCKFVKI